MAPDSSKRAVDAADNMVHAYDFNMEVPSTPASRSILGLDDALTFDYASNDDDSHPRIFKRRRSSVTSGRESPHKIPHIEHPGDSTGQSPPSDNMVQVLHPGQTFGACTGTLTPQPHYGGVSIGESSASLDYFSQNASSVQQAIPGTPGLFYDSVGKVVLNSRPLKLRELLHEAVHESLRTGGRPDFTKITETPRGERVIVEVAEARSGEEERKLVEIEVIVDETVPDSMISESPIRTPKFTHPLTPSS